jgi:hypothetical protein
VQSTPTPGSEAEHTEQRRVLEMNVKGGQAHRHPDTPAGIHSTGSFTGENKHKKH